MRITTRLVYAIVRGNYYPREVDSLWDNRESAKIHLKAFTPLDEWRIEEIEVEAYTNLEIKGYSKDE